MTYTEFRAQFHNTESFLQAYSELSEGEVRALIDAEKSPTHVKAAMFTMWQNTRRRLGDLKNDLIADGSH